MTGLWSRVWADFIDGVWGGNRRLIAFLSQPQRTNIKIMKQNRLLNGKMWLPSPIWFPWAYHRLPRLIIIKSCFMKFNHAWVLYLIKLRTYENVYILTSNRFHFNYENVPLFYFKWKLCADSIQYFLVKYKTWKNENGIRRHESEKSSQIFGHNSLLWCTLMCCG